MRNPVQPTETVCEEGGFQGERTLSHDAFGQITLSKHHISGKGERLFGSDLHHPETISITINRASLKTQRGHERISGEGTIVTVTLSEAQWARFVSSQGLGEGTPVTIDRAPPRDTPVISMPAIAPMKQATERAEQFFDDHARKVGEDVLAVQRKMAELIADKKPVSTKTLRGLQMMLIHAGEHLPGTMKFMRETFQRKMEDIVEDAKVEIETYVNNLATRTGLEVLRGQAPSLAMAEPKPVTIERDREAS